MSERSLDQQLVDGVADGRLTVRDAEEVQRFVSFLRATGGIPTRPEDCTPEQSETFRAAYREHYPEDYERAVAAQRAQP